MTGSESPGRYDGKVALITGSSRGIGQALALTLARGGASIVINYKKNAELAEKTRAEVEQAGGHAITVAADVEQPDEIDRLFGAAASKSRSISSGCSTSAATVIACPPACSTSARVLSASSAFFL